MSKLKDLTGQKFGELTVIERAEDKLRNNGGMVVRWKCKCSCGTEKVIEAYSLTSGRTTSCGCVGKQRSAENGKKNGKQLTGRRFGRLTVIGDAGKTYSGNRKMWLCKCDCGNYTEVPTISLTTGATRSCGCLKSETSTETCISREKHGITKSRIYRIWSGMKARCYCKTASGYDEYGGVGITVCAEWKNDFEKFYKWSLKNGYAEDLTIDRLDGKGNYEPSNCRWATRSVQNKNRRKFKRGKKT